MNYSSGRQRLQQYTLQQSVACENSCTVNYAIYCNPLASVQTAWVGVQFPAPASTASTLLILLPYILWNYNQLPWAYSLDLRVINQISIGDFKVLTQREQKNSQDRRFNNLTPPIKKKNKRTEWQTVQIQLSHTSTDWFHYGDGFSRTVAGFPITVSPPWCEFEQCTPTINTAQQVAGAVVSRGRRLASHPAELPAAPLWAGDNEAATRYHKCKACVRCDVRQH